MPALRPTGSAAAGPATATASTTTPPRTEPQPEPAVAPAGHRDSRRGQGRGPAPAREHGADDQRGGDQQAEDEQRRVGEAHRRRRRVSAMTLSSVSTRSLPVSTRCSGTPARRMPDRSPASRSSTPSRNFARNHGIGGVDEELLAGLRVLDHDQTDLGERVVRPVDHPQRHDVVTVREPDERALPLARADEVRDHHDQAAPRQRRDRVEHRGEIRGGRGPGVDGGGRAPVRSAARGRVRVPGGTHAGARSRAPS